MRLARPMFWGSIMAAAALACFAGASARAGDDAQFTLVVARESNLIHARLVDQQIYVDEKYQGSVSNGYRVRFAVQTSANGTYSLRVRFWDAFFTGGVVKSFSAKPGDEVFVRTGTYMGLLSGGSAIRSVHVFPLAPARLLVNPPPGGITLTFNGHENRIDSLREITTPERTTENRSLRLEIAANTGDRQEKVIVFARPGKTSLLDFTQHSAHDDGSVVSSIQLLTQLRAVCFITLVVTSTIFKRRWAEWKPTSEPCMQMVPIKRSSTCVRDTYPTFESW